MSISIGLNSKLLESSYSKLAENLIELLADRVMKAILKQPSDDQAFAKLLVTIYTQMSRVEVNKTMPPRLSNCFHDLSVYLASLHPDSRCDSSDSSRTHSDNSHPSPVPFDSLMHTGRTYMHQPLALDEIEEEDVGVSYKENQKQRFHSQPKKDRENSPMKNNFRHSLAKNYGKSAGDDIMGKYLKMSERFSEKKNNKGNKKEESLYFNNGIFFHIP